MAAKKKKKNNKTKKKNSSNIQSKNTSKVLNTSKNSEKKEETKSENINNEKVENKIDSSKENIDKEVIEKEENDNKTEVVKTEDVKANDDAKVKSDAKNNGKKEDAKSLEKKKTKKKELSVTQIKNVTFAKDKKKEEKKNDKSKANAKEQLDEKPEYVQEMLKNKRKRAIILVFTITLILIIIAFSTVFAILNLNNTTFSKGVSIKNIDVSGLTIEQARELMNQVTEKETSVTINLQYGTDFEISLLPEQIEFKYDIENAINDAYNIGRSGNIVQNNYTLLYTTFFGNDIKINYTYNGELLDKFVDDVNSNLPGICINPSYCLEDNKLIITDGTDGIRIKKEELKTQILMAINSRVAEEMVDDSYKQTLEIPVEFVEAEPIDIEKIYSEIHTEPQDAYYELEPYKIYPDIDGIDLAITVEEAKNIIASEDKEEYSFDLKISKASKTIDDLGTEAFPYLISTFSTKYDASNRNRSTNLRLAAEKINGKVLMPGEEFSFNKVVGKRTVEEGYKDAKIYADGGVVDGLAGGICQISSTLYNVVLLANLEVTERRNHTYTTSYVAAGKDATVVYGIKDFKFVNSRNYPIKIEASVSNGIAEFKIHGMQEETEYEVKILPVTTQSLPYGVSYVEDPTLVPGQQAVSQSGQSGYKVTTYKELRLNGEVISKEIISNDTYSPMRRIIRVGPGGIPPTM